MLLPPPPWRDRAPAQSRRRLRRGAPPRLAPRRDRARTRRPAGAPPKARTRAAADRAGLRPIRPGRPPGPPTTTRPPLARRGARRSRRARSPGIARPARAPAGAGAGPGPRAADGDRRYGSGAAMQGTSIGSSAAERVGRVLEQREEELVGDRDVRKMRLRHGALVNCVRDEPDGGSMQHAARTSHSTRKATAT